ncbi:MAG: pyruvate kinase [Candidatus Riflebacteria bacterium]|nr:pyruvate kinase [Candidatus Riflebacteria bacterium]
MRRTKIVCTIGPASRSPAVLEKLIRAGMDVARLNFSHGTHEEHAAVLLAIREASARLGKPIAVLQDLQGPKIRVGILADGAVTLESGATFTLTTRSVPGSAQVVSTTYAELPRDVRPGAVLLLDDGLIELEAVSVDETDVVCKVVTGGLLKQKKGINLPGTAVSAPSLTAKDRDDLGFGLRHDVDFVALSFVRRPEDLEEVRRVMRAENKKVPLIAKLEKPEALEHLHAIMEASDGVMIARGDMGVELPPERVPVVQKQILDRAHVAGVPVITATQMLESMTGHPRPTRAEASDVANAIFDGTDAIMLSAETATGDYPVEAVKMMARIARAAEASPRHFVTHGTGCTSEPYSFAEATCQAARDAAQAVKAKLVVAFTRTGSTARTISRLRPRQPIIAFTPDPAVQRQLMLHWGVAPFLMKPQVHTDALVEELDSVLLASDYANTADRIVLILGSPLNRTGATNLMKLHRVGEIQG